MEAFNTIATSAPQRSRFRNVFGVEGGVTMYVENTTTVYKIKATDNKSIYFHIDYLKNSPADIQQNIFNAVSAMNGNTPLPYNADGTTTPADTPRTLTFGTDCKVTIKSNDQFTAAEWTALCDKVVAAIERGYNKSDVDVATNKAVFEMAFDPSTNVQITLLKSATYDCEVKKPSNTVAYPIYLKTSAIDTIDLQPAVWAWVDGEEYHQP